MAERGTRLSETWIPTGKDIAYAESLGMSEDQITLEAEKFRDYWTALPGQRALKLNWEATWRNWVRKDYGKNRRRFIAGVGEIRQSEADRMAGLTIRANHINSKWCEFGAYSDEKLMECVDAGLVTLERAREVGL